MPVDLILERGNKRFVVECKAGKSPVLEKGFYLVKEDLNPTASWIIAPVDESYYLETDIRVGNVNDFLTWFKKEYTINWFILV